MTKMLPTALLAALATALEILRGSHYSDAAQVAELEVLAAGSDLEALDAKLTTLAALRADALAEIAELDALRRRICRMTAAEYATSGLATTWRCNKNSRISTIKGSIDQKTDFIAALDASRTVLSIHRPAVSERHEDAVATQVVDDLDAEFIGYENGLPVYSEAGKAALIAELLG